MQLACQERLSQAGYQQYEVSAYARAGRQCRHNLNYWLFGDYLGLGAGAHGKSSRRIGEQIAIERTWRSREPRRYLADATSPPARRKVGIAELPFEYLMNALRLRAGFETAEFERATGLSFGLLEPVLGRLAGRRLIEQCGSRWRASPQGYRFLNDVLSEFLPPSVENM
jgi:oxygen-independent coproporphyrinogen-3 oxidase